MGISLEDEKRINLKIKTRKLNGTYSGSNIFHFENTKDSFGKENHRECEGISQMQNVPSKPAKNEFYKIQKKNSRIKYRQSNSDPFFYGLSLRSNHKIPHKTIQTIEKDKKNSSIDVNHLPDEPTINAYISTPVESFGSLILAEIGCSKNELKNNWTLRIFSIPHSTALNKPSKIFNKLNNSNTGLYKSVLFDESVQNRC